MLRVPQWTRQSTSDSEPTNVQRVLRSWSDLERQQGPGLESGEWLAWGGNGFDTLIREGISEVVTFETAPKSGKALGKRMCGGRNQCKAMRWFEWSKTVSLHLRKDRLSVTDPGPRTLQSTEVVKRPDKKLRQGFPGARAARGRGDAIRTSGCPCSVPGELVP